VDYDRFKRDNHQEGIQARQESSFVEDLVQLYDACRSYETMTDKLISSEEHIWRVCQSPYRGLEGAALCVTLFIARKSYVRQVLATQEQHRSLDGTCFTLLERADALAVQAQYLTQQARRMAQVLAAGDAIYATTGAEESTTAAAVSSTDEDNDDDNSMCSYNSTDTLQC
jgi:hypothetical protein